MDRGLLNIEGSYHKIEKPEEFENSYFRKEYMQAYKIANDIVNRTGKRKENHSKNNMQLQNLIPFVGKRGSGKTSAMLSFAQSLQDYHNAVAEMDVYYTHTGEIRSEGSERLKQGSAHGWPYYIFTDDSKRLLDLEFVCLDCIDGFLLEQKEDIFRIILGQMYAKIEAIKERNIKELGDYEYKRRQLLLQFDKVYSTVCKLGRVECEKSYFEESAITSLKNLTSSLTIKNEFSKLVNQYLDLMAFCGDSRNAWNGKPAERFLVITIDDLDMNIHSGFEMLGKINRYMMVDHVIVLFAADYDQLKILCEHEFYQMVPNYDRKLREKDADVERLAKDYLEKVIPADDRIYIPDLRKVTDVQVCVGNPEMRESGLRSIPLKELVFAVIRKKLGMRLDTGGTKRHFFEQNSLRTFVNFYLMLQRMDNLSINGTDIVQDNEKNAYLTVFETNYRILMSDTLTRMVDERLNSHYKEVFQRITEMPHPNSFRNLYFEILKSTGDADNVSDDRNGNSYERNKAYLPDLMSNLEYFGYSYGEVLRIIYCWGRENVLCKETIRCLIAFYSLELSRSYQYYCYSDDDNVRQSEREKFIETMNGSISGSWANKMFPKVWYKGSEHQIGYRKEVDMNQVFLLDISTNYSEMLGGKIRWGLQKARDAEQKPDEYFDAWMKECRQMFRTLLVIGMFFEQRYYKTDKMFRWNIQEVKSSQNEQDLEDEFTQSYGNICICNADGKSYFGIFNFVSNIFCYEENLKPIIETFYDNFFWAEGSDDQKKAKEVFFQLLGIDKEVQDWMSKSHGFALPVYDFDLMYNLMKRLRQREYFSESVNPDEILDYIREAFVFIQDKLRENDEFYCRSEEALRDSTDSESDRTETRYSEIFATCPFIKWISGEKDEDGKSYLLPQFDSLFAEVIQHLLEGNASSNLQEQEAPDIHGYDD